MGFNGVYLEPLMGFMETKMNEKLMAINGEPPLKIGMQASFVSIGMYHLRPQ